MPYCANDNAQSCIKTPEMFFSSQLEERVGLHSTKIVHDFQISSTEVKTHVLEVTIQEAVR
jgi:hypothetical protein